MKEVTLLLDTQTTIIFKGLTDDEADAFVKIGDGKLRQLEEAMKKELSVDDVHVLKWKTFIRDENKQEEK